MIRATTTLCLIIFLFSSCSKVVPFIDDVAQQTYFVNSIFVVGEPVNVKTGQSISINDSLAFEYACNAEGTLQFDEKTLPLLTKQNESNICILTDNKYIIESNKQYELSAELEEQKLSGSLKTPAKYNCSFELLEIKFVDMGSRPLYMSGGIVFDTTYRYSLRLAAKLDENVNLSDKIGFTLRVLDEEFSLTNHKYIENITSIKNKTNLIEQVITDEITFNEFIFVGEIIISSKTKPAKLVPSIYFLEENLYNYMISLDKLGASINDPLSVPVKPYNNIDGGVGIFGAYSQSSDTLIVDLP